MPPLATLHIGFPTTLSVEDRVFAMPVRRTLGFVVPVAATLEVSDAVAGTFVAVVVSAEGKFETAAPFIRNGSATPCTIILKSDG